MKESGDYSFEGEKEMEKDGIVLFDIDNTLIDTKKLSFLVYTDIAKQTGKTFENISKLKDEYKDSLEFNTDFYPARLMDFLEKKIGQSIDNPFDKKEIYVESLFEETIDLLTELKKTKRLGIYSEGFTDYQTKKLEFSGIIDFFDKDLIFIKRRKLDNDSLNVIPDGATVVDDNPKVAEKLDTIKRIKAVWLNMFKDEIFEGISTIKKLSEVHDLVKVRVS